MTSVSRAGRARVLIVDPDLRFGLTLADWLAANGYHPILVRSLGTVIDELGDIQPDAILLSSDPLRQESPAHSGDALPLVRDACPTVPVITITQSNQNAWLDIFLRDGGRDSLPEPVELARMAGSLRMKLDSSSPSQAGVVRPGDGNPVVMERSMVQ
jgi:DNA-binding response OmpR family regulator